MRPPVGLYIHIPFCDAKCHYCDFVTFTDRASQIDPYLRALTMEMGFYPGTPVETLFIGGGTPTVLSPLQIEFLLSSLGEALDTSHLGEATVEANPESATEERLLAYQKGGVNRISFGLQSSDNSRLASLGRLHSHEKFVERFALARRLGFQNINVDLMFGLPGQSVGHWERTLRDVLALSPEHLSTYALKIEPGTKLAKDGAVVDQDEEADMYLLAAEMLTRAGYEHYEISNFAKPGFQSRHNLRYWQNEDTLGVGVSSASYVNGQRWKNTGKFQSYLESCLNGRPPEREETVMDPSARRKESLMLKLRLGRGVPKGELDELQIPTASIFVERGLASVQKGMYSLNRRGWLLSNLLFREMI